MSQKQLENGGFSESSVRGVAFQMFEYEHVDWAHLDGVPGIYIFAKRDEAPSGKVSWQALFIGAAQNLAQRLQNDPAWEVARRQGATHVHFRKEETPFHRERHAEDLIYDLHPPLNHELSPLRGWFDRLQAP